MDLRQQIEQEIAKDFDILKQYEDERRNENDPGLRNKWKKKIEQINQDILTRQQELQQLSKTTSPTPVANQDFIEDLGYGVKLEMVYIPGDGFLMGAPKSEEGSSDYERPQHYVTVKPFYMGKYTITQEQWEKVVYSCPTVTRELNLHPSYFKGDKLPVEQVSWYDAVEFCARLSKRTGKEYRLPSEAEWEYACRAGSAKPFAFGETITTDVVNYDGDYTYGNARQGECRGETIAVGTFIPNAFGLYDMHGNVWEWCADRWHDSYEGAPNGGSAWINDNDNKYKVKVLRGGSLDSNPDDCRSAYRTGCHRNTMDYDIGFRVVCSGAART